MKHIKNSWDKNMNKNDWFSQVGDLSNKWAVLTDKWEFDMSENVKFLKKNLLFRLFFTLSLRKIYHVGN